MSEQGGVTGHVRAGWGHGSGQNRVGSHFITGHSGVTFGYRVQTGLTVDVDEVDAVICVDFTQRFESTSNKRVHGGIGWWLKITDTPEQPQ